MKPVRAFSAALILSPMLCLLASCTISNTDPHPTTHKLLLRDLLSGPDTPESPPAQPPPAQVPTAQTPPVTATPIQVSTAQTPPTQEPPVQVPTAQTLPVQAPPVAAPPMEQPAMGMVTHVVLIWLKTPGDPDARKLLIDSSKALKAIPGVVEVHAGPMLPSTRPVVDSSYDVGLVFTFTDVQAMQEYLANPMHVKLLNEVVKPNADHYKVFDFTNQ